MRYHHDISIPEAWHSDLEILDFEKFICAQRFELLVVVDPSAVAEKHKQLEKPSFVPNRAAFEKFEPLERVPPRVTANATVNTDPWYAMGLSIHDAKINI